MSDEEKKALERIDYIQDFIIENGQYNADVNDMEYFSRIKNLIEKQSKEIEELKEKNRQSKMRIVQLENEITARIEDVNQYYTPNDKIKAKIEGVDYSDYSKAERIAMKKVLQSLLEKE